MLNYISRSQFMTVLLLFLCGMICPKEASGQLVWKMPPDVFAASGKADLDFSSDPLGNAFTVWIVDGGNEDLFVSRFSRITQSYGPPVHLSTDAVNAAVATDATETALVVWLDNAVGEILTSFFNGVTWVTPTPSPLDLIPGVVNINPDVAMNGLGDGIAGWTRPAGITPPGDIVVSIFSGTTQSWGALQVLTPAGTGGNNPIVDISANGTAVAVWLDAANNLVASNFNGLTWTALPPIIGTNVLGFGFALNAYSVQIDAAGNALALWQDAITGVMFSSYFTGGVWGVPQNISIVPVPLQGVTFDMNAAGRAMSIWTDALGFGYYSEFIGGAWTLPLPYAGNVDQFESTVALDTAGNALIAWKDVVTSEAFSILKPVNGPLGAPDVVTIASVNLNPNFSGLADNGRGFVTGSNVVDESSGVIGTYTLFPLTVIGQTCKDKFASQTDRVNIITWVASSNPDTVGYLITRNGVLIAVIPATDPLIFEDHNRCRGRDTYTITPISIFGTPLAPPSVIVLP